MEWSLVSVLCHVSLLVLNTQQHMGNCSLKSSGCLFHLQPLCTIFEKVCKLCFNEKCKTHPLHGYGEERIFTMRTYMYGGRIIPQMNCIYLPVPYTCKMQCCQMYRYSVAESKCRAPSPYTRDTISTFPRKGREAKERQECKKRNRSSNSFFWG